MGVVLLDRSAMLQMAKHFVPFDGINMVMQKYSLGRTEPFLFMLGFFKSFGDSDTKVVLTISHCLIQFLIVYTLTHCNPNAE